MPDSIMLNDSVYTTLEFYVNVFDANYGNDIEHVKYLINTSRGRIINESDLAKAIDEKIIQGYAADVISNETNGLANNILYKKCLEGKNIILTPHIGGAALEVMNKCELYISKEVMKKLHGEK